MGAYFAARGARTSSKFWREAWISGIRASASGTYTANDPSRLLDDPRDTEEVTQDVLLTVVRKIGTLRLRSRRSRAEVSLELLPVQVERCPGIEASSSPHLSAPFRNFGDVFQAVGSAPQQRRREASETSSYLRNGALRNRRPRSTRQPARSPVVSRPPSRPGNPRSMPGISGAPAPGTDRPVGWRRHSRPPSNTASKPLPLVVSWRTRIATSSPMGGPTTPSASSTSPRASRYFPGSAHRSHLVTASRWRECSTYGGSTSTT